MSEDESESSMTSSCSQQRSHHVAMMTDGAEVATTRWAPELKVTPKRIEAGVSILWDLEGEVSKETLAWEVFLAMVRATFSEDA